MSTVKLGIGRTKFPAEMTTIQVVAVQSLSHVQLHGLQHARPRCPSPSPGACPSSCPLHWWCHPAILSSDALFFLCPQSFPASGTFPVTLLFTSVSQSTRVSTSASVFPTSIQGWFPLRLIGLISLLSRGLSGVFSSTRVWKHQFFGARAIEDKVLQVKLTYFS